MKRIIKTNNYSPVFLLLVFAALVFGACGGLRPVSNVSVEKVITDYGAKGDGKTDCSAIINKLIAELPPSGGSIVIPAGEFVLDSPVVIDRSFVTLRGVNAGERSGVDVQVPGLIPTTGGGSKLIARGAPCVVYIPPMDEAKGRYTNVELRDLMLTATPREGKHPDGFVVEGNTDRLFVSNVTCNLLNRAVVVMLADAAVITDSWISENSVSVQMTGGIQNTIKGCQFGTSDFTDCVILDGEENLLYANNITTIGKSLLRLIDCRNVNITGNSFKGTTTGMLEITDSTDGRVWERNQRNMVSGNTFWLFGGGGGPQVNGERGADWGLIRVSGDNHLLSGNNIFAEWQDGITDPVFVRKLHGRNNRFDSIHVAGVPLSDTTPGRVFLFDAEEGDTGNEIINCVNAAKVAVSEGGDKSRLFIK